MLPRRRWRSTPVAPMVVWSDLRGAGRAAELQGAGFMVVPQMAAAKLERALYRLKVAEVRRRRRDRGGHPGTS